jgi:flavodoxin
LPIISTTSGDENGRSDSMKYWEIIADKLSAAGFFVGLLQRGDQRWLAMDFDARKGEGKRYIVHSDEPLSAFMELEATRAISPNANIG